MTQSIGDLPRHVAEPNPQLYWSDNYVVLDFETTANHKGSPVVGDNRIVLACWLDHTHGSNGTMRFAFGGEYDLVELVEAVQRADFIVAHNTKFELGWLRRCGIDLRKIVTFDTMIAEYVLGGNRYAQNQLGLESCLQRRGYPGKRSTVSWMLGDWPTENIPRRWLLRYCIRDVEACHELFIDQRKALKELELEAVNYARNLLTPALCDIEFQGMQLDETKITELLTIEEQKHAKLTSELQEFCKGIDPSKAKQLAGFVYNELGFTPPTDYRGKPVLTATGQFSVAAEVMSQLVGKNSTQQRFLGLYNEWTTANSNITKYLRKFGECIEHDGGRLFASFNQCATRTHRLSSTGLVRRIQFQNLNRDYKPVFCSRNDGWIVAEADGAQLEFRAAVHMGRDRVGLRYITDKDSDIHRFTASVINDVREADVTREQRQAAKPDTFKPLYGGSSGTPAQQRYYAAFKEQYKGVAATQERWTQCVLRDKKLRTEWGLIYYWPDTRMTQSGYITNTTSIYNYPVQAFATAEIIPCALVSAWHRMKDWEGFLVNTVHDSIIAELPTSEIGAWHQLSQQCLVTDSYKLIEKLYGIKITVPLGAGVMTGKRWADKDAKDGETVYEADESLWLEAAKQEGMI